MTAEGVVVLTNERDFAADEVIRELNTRGSPVRRINIEAARTAAVPPWSPEAEDQDSPKVVWWRQFELDEHPADADEIDDILVERAQWRTWVAALAGTRSAWVNELWAARRAENKIEQMRAAGHAGLRLPETVITNSRHEALAFQGHVGDCVVKTLASAYFSFSDQSFVFTELLDRLANWPQSVFSTPLIVQRLVRGLDARVIAFGGRCYGGRCRARGVDWRKTPFDPEAWEPWDIPPPISDSCQRYLNTLGLEYAAFDFMLEDGDEDVLFLEANQAGEWLFLDRALELGVSRDLASRLDQMLTQVAARSKF